ncbi:MAG TPA: poly(R)-hydroxyalkanoic acid synthase subunit PhaE [Nitrosopumilaceae archaeon]|nr:poly(R)-hydroxyalkanoic acid synthase subunit PhaE [Nitrosopumilaceae archaeon]
MKTESTKDTAEYYKHLSVFWTDLIHLMSSKPQALSSVGPMRNFAENAKKISKELIDANDDLVEFNNSLAEYYKQLTDTWNEAQKKVNFKVPEIPNDPEQFDAYKRVWIDIFDNDFTELFDSKKFGENYGKLVTKELDLTKHWNNIMNVMLHSANLPNKKEMDELYKEIHSLRKRIAKLEADSRGKPKTKKETDDGNVW